ncbi:MAG: hypothetical protein RMH77_02645 [Sulfolobales archaeon]|nr:DUF1850 domain-containing protein [Sulfolobales archaeon]MCX8185827.1 DUF1850 domain-containing protein [Sulfolobales archaeon]MDW7969288.1 hypothetical protein [Sulfolobales archaeon]
MFFALFIISLAFISNMLVLEVLEVTIDDDQTIIFEVPVRNITLIYNHSYLMVEVREVYEVIDEHICVREIILPIGGAGAPASLKDLEHLDGSVELLDGSYRVTNVNYCLGKSLIISTRFMVDWKLFINGYKIEGGKSIMLNVRSISGSAYLIAKLQLIIKSLL